MKKVLTTGNRASVFKLLEMMLQRSDLGFVHTGSFSRCLEMTSASPPVLLLIDCETETQADCLWLLEALKNKSSATRPRTLVVAAAGLDDAQLGPLEKLADGCIREPFTPLEIGRIGREYL